MSGTLKLYKTHFFTWLLIVEISRNARYHEGTAASSNNNQLTLYPLLLDLQDRLLAIALLPIYMHTHCTPNAFAAACDTIIALCIAPIPQLRYYLTMLICC
jgi:hypothetical protein